jgi:hypothetical protein
VLRFDIGVSEPDAVNALIDVGLERKSQDVVLAAFVLFIRSTAEQSSV